MATMADFLASRKETSTFKNSTGVVVETAKAFIDYANTTGGRIENPGKAVADVIQGFLNDNGHSDNKSKEACARHLIAMYELLAQLVRGSEVTWTDGNTYSLKKHAPPSGLVTSPPETPKRLPGGNPAGTK